VPSATTHITGRSTNLYRYNVMAQMQTHISRLQVVQLNNVIPEQREVTRIEITRSSLMLTTGSTRLAVSRGQQTWYRSTCYI